MKYYYFRDLLAGQYYRCDAQPRTDEIILSDVYHQQYKFKRHSIIYYNLVEQIPFDSLPDECKLEWAEDDKISNDPIADAANRVRNYQRFNYSNYEIL